MVVLNAELLLILAIFSVCPKHAVLVLITLLVLNGALFLVIELAYNVILVFEALHAVNHILFVHFEEKVHWQKFF